MQTVLVTGGAGFLGSHVVDALIVKGVAVAAVDNLVTGRAEWCAAPLVTSDFHEAEHELRGADAIVHCAAVADISHNWAPNHNRRNIFRANVLELHYMLEVLAKGTMCKRFVFVSTAAVDAPQQSPYTASKLAGEAMVRAYCQALNIALTIVRPVSMLGPRYHHGHIADFVRMQHKNGAIDAKDNGHQRKPYVHVRDVADRIVRHLATESLGFSTIVPGVENGATVDIVPGVPWGICSTALLMNCPLRRPTNERGWMGDPDVNHFIDGDASPWVLETIEWCRKEISK